MQKNVQEFLQRTSNRIRRNNLYPEIIRMRIWNTNTILICFAAPLEMGHPLSILAERKLITSHRLPIFSSEPSPPPPPHHHPKMFRAVTVDEWHGIHSPPSPQDV